MQSEIKMAIMELNLEHTKRLDERISGMIALGFVLGVVFSYSGILGFSAGFVLGFTVMRKLKHETRRWSETAIGVFQQVVTSILSKTV